MSYSRETQHCGRCSIKRTVTFIIIMNMSLCKLLGLTVHFISLIISAVVGPYCCTDPLSHGGVCDDIIIFECVRPKGAWALLRA